MTKILFSVRCLFSNMAVLWSVKKEVNSGNSGLHFFSSILSWIHLDNSCQGPQGPKPNAVVNSQFSFPLNSQKHLAWLVTTSFLKYFLPLASRAPYYPSFPVAPHKPHPHVCCPSPFWVFFPGSPHHPSPVTMENARAWSMDLVLSLPTPNPWWSDPMLRF